MTSDPIGTFTQALREHDTSLTRTDPDRFPEALVDLVEPPIVGAPFPFDDVSLTDDSLAEVAIETELTTAAIRDASTGISAAGFAIAESGSVVLQPTNKGEEPVSLFPERHVVVVREQDILPDVTTMFDRLADEFADGQDDAVLATGPSATADMGSLVSGVHGPESVHVLLVETVGKDNRTPDNEVTSRE